MGSTKMRKSPLTLRPCISGHTQNVDEWTLKTPRPHLILEAFLVWAPTGRQCGHALARACLLIRK